MILKIRLKHLLIPVLVFMITFIIVIVNYNRLFSDQAIEVALLYNGPGINVTSEEKNYWDALSLASERYQDEVSGDVFASMKFQSYSYESLSEKKFNEIINNKNIILVLGDDYNEVLNNILDRNKSKQFILVDNSEEFKQKNVSTITYDYKTESNGAAITLLEHSVNDQYLYISTNTQNNDIAYNLFEEKILKSQPEAVVEHYIVTDIYNNSNIISTIDDYCKLGFDNFYIADPEIAEITISTLVKYQIFLNEELILFQNELLAYEELNEEVLEEDQEELEEPTFDYLQKNINVLTNTFDFSAKGALFDIEGEPVSIVIDSFARPIDEVIFKVIFDYAELEFKVFDKKINMIRMSSEEYQALK